MSQRVQQRKRTPGRAVNKQPPKHASVRPVVVRQSNHVRATNDKWERQADSAAERILREEHGVAKILTPLSAASVHIPASLAEPLSGKFCQKLEKGFGANLSAVRVHRDVAANVAAIREHADAFTSGSHIYFSRNSFNPDSTRGYNLLSHEIAHVLQQTGRHRSDGLFHATDITSSGNIQKREVYFIEEPQETATVLDLEAMVTLYQALVPANEGDQLEGVITEVRMRLLQDNSGVTVASWVTDANALDNTDYYSSTTRAFVHDCLKRMGYFEAAAHMLQIDPTLPTTFHSVETFLLATQLIGQDWVFGQLSREPLHYYYPWQFVDTFRRYLLGPTRDIQSLYSRNRTGEGGEEIELGNFQPFADRTLSEISTDRLNHNELYYSAVYNLKRADLGRVTAFLSIVEEVSAGFENPNPLYVRYEVASRFVALLQSVSETGDEGSIVRLIIRQRDSLLTVGQRAMEVWGEVMRLKQQAATSGMSDEHIEVLTRYGSRTELAPIREALLSMGNRLFALRRNSLPSARRYNDVISTLKTEYQQFRYNLIEAPLIGLARTSDEFDTELAVAYGLLWDIVEPFKTVLDEYSFNDDRSFMDGLPDVRVANRIRAARWFSWFGRVLGWSTLPEMARPVLEASQEGITENQVALLSDWAYDSSRSVESIASISTGGFDGELRGLNSITSSHIARIFRIQYYQTISSRIEEMLSDEEGDVSEESRGRLSVMSRVANDLEQLAMPKRFRIMPDQVEIAIQPPQTTGEGQAGSVEAAPASRTAAYVLIENHPKTQQRLADENVSLADEIDFTRPIAIWPVGGPVHNAELYFWVIPPLQPLVERLQQISELDVLVQMQLDINALAEPMPAQESEGATEAVEEEEPDWLLWLKAFLQIDINDPSLADHYSARLFTASLGEEREVAYQTAVDQIRRAFSHQRQRLVVLDLQPLLNRFDRYAAVSESFQLREGGEERTVFIRLLPDEVFEILTRFILQLPEQEERDAHFAMAMVELSATIEAKLGDRDMLDDEMRIVRRYAPLISAALDRVDQGELENYYTGDENATMVATGAERLERVLITMVEVIEENQEEWGIEAVVGDGTFESSGYVHELESSRRLDRNVTFTIDGNSWQIIQVLQSFRYHPSAFSRLRSESRHLGSSILIVNGERMSPEQRASNGEGNILLYVRINENPTPIAITASNARVNERLLEQLAWSAIRYSTVAQMVEVAQMLEAGAEFAMDVAELFPVVGPAVAATRLVAGVTAFITSDLDALLESLINDPRALFEHILSDLDSALAPESILEYFLFGNVAFEGLRRRRGRAPRVRTGGSRRAQRIFSKLMRLGEGVAAIFSRMQGNVRDTRQAAQLSITQHPVLVRVITVIADYYQVLLNLPDLVEELADFSSHAQTLGTSIHHTINSLGSVELPEQLIPMEDIVGLVIDIIGHRLGGKYKAAVRVLLALLDLVGARQELERAIADGIRALGVDTDDILPIWQGELVPFIQQKLGEAQIALRDEFNRVFAAIPSLDLEIEESTPNLQLSGNDFPETQPYLDPTAKPGLPISSKVAGGVSLPSSLRVQSERRFGQDFSHVRIHTDTTARLLNYKAGARGLTTGSHIFLDRHTTSSSSDAHILNHELAHVVQQTGNRPLGRRHSHQPQMGKPGRGMNIHQASERSADRAAKQAKHGFVSEPLSSQGRKAEGWQPSIVEDLGQRFLRYLVAFESIEAEVARVDATEAGTGARLIGRDVRNTVENVASSLSTIFNRRQTTTFKVQRSVRDTFGSKRDQIGAHLYNQRQAISNAIEDLAIQASYVFRRATATSPPQMALRVHKFKDKLVRYIFGRTGVLLDIELNTTRRGRNALLNRSNPVNAVTVQFLHLPPISSNSNLWRDALTHRTTVTGRTPIPEDERGAVRTRVRQVVRGMGPSSQVWSNDGYRLSRHVFEAVDELARQEQEAGAAGQVAAEDLPAKSYYLDTDSTAHTTTSGGADIGNVGLRLGTYGQRLRQDGSSPRGPQWARERESHHITQYLLVEYFHNGKGNSRESDSDRMAFPLIFARGPDAYPELTLTAENMPNTYRSIQIATLEEGRGAEMPAISIARPTHRRGRLHVSPYADDFNDAPDITTQAGAVNRKFMSYLTSAYKAKEEAALASEAGYTEWVQWRDNNTTQVAGTIHSAMQHTYKWMRDYMQARLQVGLRVNEREYYNDLGEATTRTNSADYQIRTSEMDTVFTAAVGHNRRGMERYGWTG